MTRTHRQLAIASALMLLCAACGGLRPSGAAPDEPARSQVGTSSASCVAPYLSDQAPSGPFRGPTPTVSPGDTIVVHGYWYTNTCNDTGGHDPLQPLPPVHLTLTLPGRGAVDLGAFHPAGPDMGFTTEILVPIGTRAGTGTVRDDQEYPSTFRFKVGR